MKVYILYYQYHYDCYKRAETSSGIVDVFKNKDDAYKNAVEYLKREFIDHIYKQAEDCCDEHKFEKDGEDIDNYECLNCCYTFIKENGKIVPDFMNHEELYHSREHLLHILNDDTTSDIQKYNYIHNNLYEIIGDGEFTMQPTHHLYFVSEKDLI